MTDPTRFILMHTSHGGNVGSAARAIKVMGFGDLVLVRPRFADVLSREETVAYASGAADVLARARIVDTLAEALDALDRWRYATGAQTRLPDRRWWAGVQRETRRLRAARPG